MGGGIHVEPTWKLWWKLGGNVTWIPRVFDRGFNVESTWKFGGIYVEIWWNQRGAHVEIWWNQRGTHVEIWWKN